MSNREKIDQVVKDFQDATYAYYKSHAYACGYLGSTVTTLLMDMPEEEREFHIRSMMENTIMMQKMSLMDTIKDAA